MAAVHIILAIAPMAPVTLTGSDFVNFFRLRADFLQQFHIVENIRAQVVALDGDAFKMSAVHGVQYANAGPIHFSRRAQPDADAF